MQKIRSFFIVPRNQIIAGVVVGILLLVGATFALFALLKGDTTDTPTIKVPEITQESSFSSTVSKLSGTTTSTRNLKGLTLRINQIETCNPTVVSAYVAVSTDGGVVSTNFSKKDVKVYLDNKELKDFEFKSVDGVKTPLTNMLVIDHSGSMAGAALDNAKSAATQYIQKLRVNDQVGIIQFDDRIETLVGITTDKNAVVSAVGGIQARGNTAVYDAIAAGIAAVPNCGRKAVTVLSDGDDISSKLQTPSSVTNLANKANLPIFSVGIKGDGFNPASMKTISAASGGQYLEANTPAEIAGLYANIDGQLSGQFVVNLSLSLTKNSTVHTLKVVSSVEGSPTTSERSFIY